MHDHAVICYHVTLLKYFLQHQEGMGKWIRPLILILSSVAFIDIAFQLFKWRLYHCQTRHGFNRVSKIQKKKRSLSSLFQTQNPFTGDIFELTNPSTPKDVTKPLWLQTLLSIPMQILTEILHWGIGAVSARMLPMTIQVLQQIVSI